jgi:hypothetical protein
MILVLKNLLFTLVVAIREALAHLALI